MAVSYLLTEDGFKILLEDSSGALLLEDGVAPEYRKCITLRDDRIDVIKG